MFRTVPRRTHRAPGPAVIDYRGLAAPVGRGAGGVAVLSAVTAAAALHGAGSAEAQAPTTTAVRGTTTPAAAGSATAPATGTTAAPATSYSSVKLRLGARGSAVKELQSQLNAHGASLAKDGVFGSKTLKAVKSFQSSKSLAVDGVVGPKTWGALGSSSSSGSSGSTGSSSQSTLRSGDRGSAVKTLQTQLNARGASLSVDGVFGSKTLSAVRSLQSAAGIGVDGVVGSKTWNALYSDVRISSSSADRDSDRTSSSSINGSAIVSAARSQLGVGYKWGGSSPSAGFDCSGLVYYAYNQAGVDISRKTAKGYTFGGTIISQSQAQPGDLVAFSANDWGHVAIYAGNGKIIDASGSRQRVVERSIWDSPHVFVTYR